MQGDVVGIVDSSGTEVVKYTYDAWGRLLSKTGTMASTFGTLNPFRYRGYVYDEETGLYYLRSRYYNPIWGRFVNADQIITDNKNLFSYCNNLPTTSMDSDGYAAAVLLDPAYSNGSLLFGFSLVEAGSGGGYVSDVSSIYYAMNNVRGYDRWHRNSRFNLSGQNAVHSNNSVACSLSDDQLINNALKQLETTGPRPGQTVVSRSKILQIANNWSSTKAYSSVVKINGTYYLVEGHHTTVASVIVGKGSGSNMGMRVYHAEVQTNIHWYRKWYQITKRTIRLID